MTATAVSSENYLTTPEAAASGVTIEIGDVPVRLESDNDDFRRMMEERYSGFVNSGSPPAYRFRVSIESPSEPSDDDARVWKQGRTWIFERGDFRAEWNAACRRGSIRQSLNPYSADTVLRIVHSLVLAEQGGFLLHAASAVRNGRAFLFTGISGAGKTTISRLAPPDAPVLTDEISYVRPAASGYHAYGTPFAGELARVGANLSAPVAALYFLEKGPTNCFEPIEKIAAARSLLRNILFFAHDEELVKRVFDAALGFVSRVPVTRLVFTPDERVWNLIA